MASAIVMGGGIGGLTVADRLASAGWSVTLFERGDALGGLARGVEIDGCRVDLGPHNVRAKGPEVLAYYRELIGEDLLPRVFRTKLYFRGRLLSYPINPLELIGALPVGQLVRYGGDLVGERLRSPFREAPGSYEEWAVAQYGRSLYGAFFRPLTEKTWGVEASQLDVRLARDRLPPFSLRRLLLGLGKPHREEPGASRHYYPRLGVAQLVDALEARLRRRGVEIRLGGSVERVELGPSGVTVRSPQGTARGDFLISSIPLPALCGLLPELGSAEGLRYRPVSFTFLSVDEGARLAEPFLYVADPGIALNRVTDFSYFSRDCLRPGRSVWCVEHGEGDPVEALHRLGWLARGRVHEVRRARAEAVYPVYARGHAERLRGIFERASAQPRLLLVGRQGLFSHSNIDDVMGGAFAAARLLRSGGGDAREKLRYYLPTL